MKQLAILVLMIVCTASSSAEIRDSSELHSYLDKITYQYTRQYVNLCAGSKVVAACKNIQHGVATIVQSAKDHELDEVSKIKINALKDIAELASNEVSQMENK